MSCPRYLYYKYAKVCAAFRTYYGSLYVPLGVTTSTYDVDEQRERGPDDLAPAVLHLAIDVSKHEKEATKATLPGGFHSLLTW